MIKSKKSIHKSKLVPCCKYNNCIKKVLMVGGITKFRSLYKKVIEQHGYQFEYMDGYMKGGDKVLKNKLLSCDIVFCPVDCNSHNACLSVKKLCKKHCKELKILNSSSLTGILRAVSENVASP
ncbi:hypothetical protein JCM14036_26190 [Desulfotomaculum defluvii]